MNRQLLSALAVLVIGSCVLAKAAEPTLKSPQPVIVTAVETAKPTTNSTPYQFPGKLVRVQMTGGTRNEVFVLENATLTPLNPMNGSEWFIVGTGIKNGPRLTSWCEGLEVHLNLRLVASYCPLTPEQWKDQQRIAPRPPAGSIPPPPKPATGSGTTPPKDTSPPLVPPQPTGPIPPLPQPAVAPPLPPTPPAVPIPTPPQPEAGPPLVLPTPQVVPNPLLPSQPAVAPSSASGIDAQLKAAQNERVKLLTQVVEILTEQHKVAAVDYSQVASAESDLCNALLDSTDEPEKRIPCSRSNLKGQTISSTYATDSTGQRQ